MTLDEKVAAFREADLGRKIGAVVLSWGAISTNQQNAWRKQYRESHLAPASFTQTPTPHLDAAVIEFRNNVVSGWSAKPWDELTDGDKRNWRLEYWRKRKREHDPDAGAIAFREKTYASYRRPPHLAHLPPKKPSPWSSLTEKNKDKWRNRYATSLRTGTIMYDAFSDASCIAQNLLPNPEQSTMITIEQRTYVDNQNITDLSTDEIIRKIQTGEAEIERLTTLKHKPQRIKKMLTDLEAGLIALVAAIDKRDDHSEPETPAE